MTDPSGPPFAHRSSNGEDAAPSSAEMAVRPRPRCSIPPKGLDVRSVQPREIRGVIEQRHYLHAMPQAAIACYGVYAGSALLGAVVFTAGGRKSHLVVGGARPGDGITLARLWLDDALAKNSESRVIGVTLRQLRREGRWRFVLSYADPAAGHTGAIYRAAGWPYLGQSPDETYVGLPGGVYHPRSVYGRFGTTSIRHLRSTGIDARRVWVPGKHRYIAFLDPSWAWRLRAVSARFGSERGPPRPGTRTACGGVQIRHRPLPDPTTRPRSSSPMRTLQAIAHTRRHPRR